MKWIDIKTEVQVAYKAIGKGEQLYQDELYLMNAFERIESLWNCNFEKLQRVDYILISEAPLWQDRANYFYNEAAPLTQFLYKNDIGVPLGIQVRDKSDLFKVMADIGFVILDASPLPLAEGFTSITYNRISKKQYRILMQAMIHSFLKKKMEMVLSKASDDVQFIFRYKRVEQALRDPIEIMLLELGVDNPSFTNIGQQGGGVDRNTVKSLLSIQK